MIDLVISQKTDGETFMFSQHKLSLRDICVGMLVLPEGAASMSLKDKPVGGTKTGLTGHESLGLVHKPVINF